MKKFDPTVIAETRYIAAFVAVLSLLMEGVFLVLGKWDYFFLLGVTVTKAMTKDEKDMGSYMKLSKAYRSLMILAVAGIGLGFKCFNDVAVILPLFFPQVGIYARGLKLRKSNVVSEGGEQDAV